MSDLTDKWLKTNDPLYYSKEKDYLTSRNERKIREKKEISASCLRGEVIRQLMGYPYRNDNKIRRIFGR